MAASGEHRCPIVGRNSPGDHIRFISAGAGDAVGVPLDRATLPDDPATLQHLLRAVIAAAEQQHSVLQDAVQQREAEIDKLHLLIKRLLRQQFGRRSEQLNPDQLLLGIEDLEQTIAENQAKQDAADAAADKPQPRRAARASAAV
jgi:transposase